MLQSMGLQIVIHNWVSEQQWIYNEVHGPAKILTSEFCSLLVKLGNT